MGERKIYAELRVDEMIAMRHAEVNGLSSDGTVDYLEKEFGWLEASGIRLAKAFISDEDDANDWCCYIDYLVSWAFAHTYEENDFPRAMTYEEWRIENGRTESPLVFKKKYPLVVPNDCAEMLVGMLGKGEQTVNGDRTSGYVNIATDRNEERFVKASLIEEAKDLFPEDAGYALHILNDIDETDGRLVRTARLDTDELADLLKEVLEALQEGRM